MAEDQFSPNSVTTSKLNATPKIATPKGAAQSIEATAFLLERRARLAISARISPANPEIAIQGNPAPVAAAAIIPIKAKDLAIFEIIEFLLSPSDIAANVGATRTIRTAHIAPNQLTLVLASTYLEP
jgi:hypothetical protein